MHKVALVVPCFNEQEIIRSTLSILSSLYDNLIAKGTISPDSTILLVDDGSTDNTLKIVETFGEPHIKVIKLATNVGHQHALLAGLHYATNKVDCCISIDADLQDDIRVIEEMISRFAAGFQIVYGVRKKRDTDHLIKKQTALLFYKLMRSMGIKIIYNHADYRLLSNKVLLAFREYTEVNLFLRGIFPLMGYQSTTVYYDRLERQAGESKYPFFKMLKLAVDGITSFSVAPLRIITGLGLLTFLISIGGSIWVFSQFLRDQTIPGWASISLPMYFLGGIQLLAIGVLGEYISKIYYEAKGRPRYHIEEVISYNKNQKIDRQLTETSILITTMADEDRQRVDSLYDQL